MDIQCRYDIKLATEVLASRVLWSGSISANIVLPADAERVSDYNEHLSRLTGFFIDSQGRIGFLLLGREIPGQDISHVFLFYVNSDYKSVPSSEIDLLKRRLKYKPRLFVTNIVMATAPFSHLAVLIEAMEFILRLNLFEKHPPLILRVSKMCSHFTENISFPYPQDCSLLADQDAETYVQFLNANDVVVVDLESSNKIPLVFHILRIKYNGHLVYGLNYPADKALLLLLPHNRQLEGEPVYKKLTESIHNKLGYKIGRYVASRMKTYVKCNSIVMLKACILCLHLPLLNVSQHDLDCLAVNSTRARAIQSPVSEPLSPLQPGFANDSPIPSDSEVMDIQYSQQDPLPAILSVSSSYSNPETVVMTGTQIRDEIEIFRLQLIVREDLTLNYPHVARLGPSSIPKGTILKNPGFFFGELERIASLWLSYTTVFVGAQFDLRGDLHIGIEESVDRFLILLVVDTGENSLLIIDKRTKVWAYMHPSVMTKDQDEALDRMQECIVSRCSGLAKFTGHVILLTSHFHKDLHNMHLLMGLYYVGRLFKYVVMLPQKVVYNERDFRHYCDNICLKLQVANQEYNLNNGLIDSNGLVKREGMVSAPSPVCYERSVVVSDLCAFCKQRGFQNLGRHIAMNHAGQALQANYNRQAKYGFKKRA